MPGTERSKATGVCGAEQGPGAVAGGVQGAMLPEIFALLSILDARRAIKLKI